jgi:thiamine biosynthesis protein ThiS
MDGKIKIVVNGFEEEVPSGSSIEFLIKHFKEIDPNLIVELNGRFIYPKEYPASIIKENDRVEFVNPNLGG